MPLWYYLPVHRDAALSADDRALLRTWALEAAQTPAPVEDK